MTNQDKFTKNSKSDKIHLYLIGLCLVIFMVGLDQLTKYLAVIKLKGQPSVVLIKNVFELHYLENQGAAFSMLQGKKMFFIIITVFMIVCLTYILGRIPAKKPFFVFHGIIIALIAGAIGNFIDRIRFDYVIDFFYFSLINFPIFNVADIYITCAMILFVIVFLFFCKEEDLDQLWRLIKPSKNEHGESKHE